MTISINPAITTNAAGTFTVTLDGMIQGMAMDDPAVRFQLTGGMWVPAAGDNVPIFGGIPITENIPANNSAMDPSLGNAISRAIAAPGTQPGGMMGISVFNQAHAMVSSPQSPVQQASTGMSVNFYRIGSNARIALAMDPAFPIVAGPPGYVTWPVVGAFNWNAVNGWVTAAAAGAGGFALPNTLKVIGYNIGNSMTVTYDAVTGFATWNRQGSTILLQI